MPIIRGPQGFVTRQQAMLRRINFVKSVLELSQTPTGTAVLRMEELAQLVNGLPEDVAMGMIRQDADGNLKERTI